MSSITITPIAPNNQKPPIHPNSINIRNNKSIRYSSSKINIIIEYLKYKKIKIMLLN